MAACLACLACETCCSLFSACCSCAGCLCSGKGSPTPRNPMVGKIRSFGLIMTSIVVGLIFQYLLANDLWNEFSQWRSGCQPDGITETNEYTKLCAGNAAIYRVGFVDSVLFLLFVPFAIGHSLGNNRCWGLRIGLWIGLFLACIFIPNVVFDTRGFVWFARFGAMIFTILQQVVIIEIAYSLNDGAVAVAEERGGVDGGGKSILIGLLLVSVFCFLAALAGLGVLFHFFTGCVGNDIVLSLTLILCVIVTAAQLMGSEGNLFTSAVITGYSVYLSYTAVSKNPDRECNPQLGETNEGTIIIGILLTMLSLSWVCFSSGTAVTNLFGSREANLQQEAANSQIGSPSSASKKQVILRDEERGVDPAGGRFDAAAAAAAPSAAGGGDEEPEELDDGGDAWKFNMVMVLLSMYFTMQLTNWGDIQTTEGFSSDPKTGRTGMWMTMAGQWTALLLYLWSLIAPKLFPDREFS